MAHGRPWYPRAGAALVLGTLHMPSSDHKWAYSAIIDMLNDRDRPLPDDAAFICGFTGLSKRKWGIVREFLLNDRDSTGTTRLFLNAQGDITNPRFERERAKRKGDDAAAVENGRIGGTIAAGNKAAEQIKFDLSPKKQGDKREINARSLKDKSEITAAAPNENNDLALPPPVPIRARVREERLEYRESASPTAEPRTARAAVDAVDEFSPSDLEALTRRLGERGGVSVDRNLERETTVVRGWLDLGADLHTTIVPAIDRQFADTTEPSINSLSFYTGRITKDHAKAKRSAGRGALKAPRPIMAPAGEDVRFAAVRVDLLAALGNYAYCTFLNAARFDVEGSDEMRISGKGFQHSRIMDDRRDVVFQDVAKAHGFAHVSVRTR